MAIAHVQGNKGDAGAVTTLTVNFLNAVNAGDLLVIAVRAGTGGTVTVADNINGAWTQDTVNGSAFIFHFKNTAAAAANTLAVTVTATAQSATIRLVMDEFSGAAGLLTSSNTLTAATTALACVATAAVSAGNLVYAGFLTSGASETFTVGTSQGVACVAGQTLGDALGSAFSEYVLSSAAGTQAPTCTASGSFATSALCVVFSPTFGTPLAPHPSIGQPAMPTPVPVLLRGGTVAASGSPRAAAPRADYLPTPVGAILVGGTVAASGKPIAPHPSIGQPAMPTPVPVLLRGGTVAASGSPRAAAPRADYLPTPVGAILVGGTVAASGVALAAASLAAFLPTPTGAFFQVTVIRSGVPLAAAPRADILPTPIGALYVGGAAPASGTPLAPHPSIGQPAMPTPLVVIFPGGTAPAAGSPLAPHPSIGQPAMPTPVPVLLAGGTVAASGSPLAAAPRADFLPTPTGAFFQVAVTRSGVPLATAPRADILPTPIGALYAGGAAPTSGTPLAPHPSIGQPAMPTPVPALLAGGTVAASGTPLHAAFRADYLPTPVPTWLTGGIPLYGTPLTAAPSADFLPTPIGAIFRGGAALASGKPIAPHPSIGQPAMPTPVPALLAGGTVAASGVVLATAPIAAFLPTPTGLFFTGATVPAGSPLAAAPRADVLPTPAGLFFTGAAPAAGQLRTPSFPLDPPTTLPTPQWLQGVPAPYPPPPDPSHYIPAQQPPYLFGGSSGAAGGGGAVSWISLPGQPLELLQGNWLRDPIVAPQVDTREPPSDLGQWWNNLLHRSGYTALAKVPTATVTTVDDPAAALGQIYLTIAEHIAAKARAEQARRIELEQAIATLFTQRATQDAATQAERARLHAEMTALAQRVQAQETELQWLRQQPAQAPTFVDPIPDYVDLTWAPVALGEPEPVATSAAPRKLWPIAFVGIAIVAAACLVTVATTMPLPPPTRKRRQDP